MDSKRRTLDASSSTPASKRITVAQSRAITRAEFAVRQAAEDSIDCIYDKLEARMAKQFPGFVSQTELVIGTALPLARSIAVDAELDWMFSESGVPSMPTTARHHRSTHKRRDAAGPLPTLDTFIAENQAVYDANSVSAVDQMKFEIVHATRNALTETVRAAADVVTELKIKHNREIAVLRARLADANSINTVLVRQLVPAPAQD